MADTEKTADRHAVSDLHPIQNGVHHTFSAITGGELPYADPCFSDHVDFDAEGVLTCPASRSDDPDIRQPARGLKEFLEAWRSVPAWQKQPKGSKPERHRGLAAEAPKANRWFRKRPR